MCRMLLTRAAALLFCGPFMITTASGQTSSDPIAVRVIAEVEAHISEHGRSFTRLVPASKLVPGDKVLYTLEVRNVGPTSLEAPVVKQPVPAHMLYLPDSAVGPGAEVSYSIDGGRSFDLPENLKVPGPNGAVRSATAADYTDIRWQLHSLLKSNSVAFVRFRAQVK